MFSRHDNDASRDAGAVEQLNRQVSELTYKANSARAREDELRVQLDATTRQRDDLTELAGEVCGRRVCLHRPSLSRARSDSIVLTVLCWVLWCQLAEDKERLQRELSSLATAHRSVTQQMEQHKAQRETLHTRVGALEVALAKTTTDAAAQLGVRIGSPAVLSSGHRGC